MNINKKYRKEKITWNKQPSVFLKRYEMFFAENLFTFIEPYAWLLKFDDGIDINKILNKVIRFGSEIIQMWCANCNCENKYPVSEKVLLCEFELRLHWCLLTILKTSNQSVWSDIFWYVKV